MFEIYSKSLIRRGGMKSVALKSNAWCRLVHTAGNWANWCPTIDAEGDAVIVSDIRVVC